MSDVATVNDASSGLSSILPNVNVVNGGTGSSDHKVLVSASDVEANYLSSKIVAKEGGGITVETVEGELGVETLEISYNPTEYYAKTLENFAECFVNYSDCGLEGAAAWTVLNPENNFRFRDLSYIEVPISSYQALSASVQLYAAIYKNVDGVMTRVACTESVTVTSTEAANNTKVKLYIDTTKTTGELEAGSQYYIAIGSSNPYVGVYGFNNDSPSGFGSVVYPNFTLYDNMIDILTVTSFDTADYSLNVRTKIPHLKLVY